MTLDIGKRSCWSLLPTRHPDSRRRAFDGGTGKLDATTSGNEAQAYGILLDATVDTTLSAAFSDGTVTGSVARAGSFRGPAPIVGTGTNVATLTDALRKNGIFIEGPVTVPVTKEEETAPAGSVPAADETTAAA
jgi:hypothetical protein